MRINQKGQVDTKTMGRPDRFNGPNLIRPPLKIITLLTNDFPTKVREPVYKLSLLFTPNHSASS